MTRKNKSVSFDLTDEYERKLLAHAEQSENGRYSKYIKRLISNDMKGVTRNSIRIQNPAEVEIGKNDMNGFL